MSVSHSTQSADSPVEPSIVLSDELLTFNAGLFDYLDKSPSTFHAIEHSIAALSEAGFKPLKESDPWNLEVGARYYIQRNDSSLIAFHYANEHWPETSLRLFGAHCDSPCLKVKPQPEKHSKHYLSLGVEVYGGVLLNPWFDRDLSLAGRVVVELLDKRQVSVLINFERAIALIPSLAIHLDREANSKRSISPQTDILPIIAQQLEGSEKLAFKSILEQEIAEKFPDISAQLSCICDYELAFYDVQKSAYIGLHKEFFASARLDNLLSCYVGVQALIEGSQSENPQNTLLVINDHEEVGSQTAQGAQGPFLSKVIERICGSLEASARCLAGSMLISADNAHGIHPNFPSKHDLNHGPILNAGPVIKINANQRYATNSISSAKFKQIAKDVGVTTQSFVVRSDMACGSTIGPVTSAELGVQTLDVGVPTFAMHSIRESAGTQDAYSLFKIAKQFFQIPTIFE